MDVLSMVVMRDASKTELLAEPFDWILYNRLVDMMRSLRPGAGGCHIPALDRAEELFAMNRSRRCALGLLFFSDVRPSDHKPRGSLPSSDGIPKEIVNERVQQLASVCGKRLTVWCLAIGQPQGEDFSVLKSMTVTASEYKCQVFFKPACLSSGALSTALRSLSTTMTDTMTTLAETHKSDREYREFVKMPLSEVGSSTVTDTWEVVKLQTTHYTVNMRVRGGWTIVTTSSISNVLQNCNADRLAFETRWFGEGKERLVKEMREVCTSTGHFVGPPLVAKASILDEDKEGEGKKIHKRFLKTQLKSQQLAQLFNEALERVPEYLRTDRRKEGIDDFFKTHTCSELCCLLRRRHSKSSWNDANAGHLLV